MGNTFTSEEKVNRVEKSSQSLYITERERDALMHLYKQISTEGNNIDKDHVSEVFNLQERSYFKKALLLFLAKHISNAADFEEFIIKCTRSSVASTIETFWNLSNGSDEPSTESFLKVVIELALHECNTEQCNMTAQRMTNFIETLSVHVGHIEGVKLDLRLTSIELNNYLPNTAKALETYMSQICFKGLLSPSYKPFCAPVLDTPSEVADAYTLLPLALHSEAMQGQWKRLYSTSVDGISFNRVAYHTLGYDGPTCVLIKCQDPDNTVIGIIAHDRWRDSNRFYGSSKNALFVLKPKLRIYRSKTPSNASYQWLNTKSHTLPKGMGFGGSTEGFRVFIPESLEGCTATNSCPTYETGKLVENERFEIQTLEVWGCGGSAVVETALKAQAEERALADENIDKARHVDKAQFFNNEFDKEFFLSNTMSQCGKGEKERFGNA